MDLKKAIQQVTKVIPKKSELAQAYGFVRFVPPSKEGGLSRVYATDGSRLHLAQVETELPPALLEAALLMQAAKDPGEMRLENYGYGKMELQTEHNRYAFQSADPDEFVSPPVVPEKAQCHLVERWAEVPQVLHAAMPEKEDPDLAVVRFTPEYVEAMDKNRLARVEVEQSWAGLVQANLFKAWPKGKVHYWFSEETAYFWIGDELRMAPIRKSVYPATDAVIPKVHPGPSVLVPTKALDVAVKQGTAVSGLGLVNLAIEPERVIVRAWQEGEVGENYEADIPVYWGGKEHGNVLVNGKYFGQALKPVETPNVKLGYGHMADPLRLESGNYIACLWQMVY